MLTYLKQLRESKIIISWLTWRTVIFRNSNKQVIIKNYQSINCESSLTNIVHTVSKLVRVFLTHLSATLSEPLELARGRLAVNLSGFQLQLDGGLGCCESICS